MAYTQEQLDRAKANDPEKFAANVIKKMNESALNAGSPAGNPGFSFSSPVWNTDTQRYDAQPISWLGEGDPTQEDKQMFANWVNSQNPNYNMTGDFATQNWVNPNQAYLDRQAEGMLSNPKNDRVVQPAPQVQTPTGMLNPVQETRDPTNGVDQTPSTNGVDTSPFSNLTPGSEAEQAFNAGLEELWASDPDAMLTAMIGNPEAFGFTAVRENAHRGRTVGVNEDGSVTVLNLGYEEATDFNDPNTPKGAQNVQMGVGNRPEAPDGVYLPGKPAEMTPENIQNWHSYYRNNPELTQHLSMDERQDLMYLDYLTGNYDSYEDYKNDSYDLRNEFGYERHYGVEGRDSHRFEYQWNIDSDRINSDEDRYSIFADTHQDIGGFYDQEDLPGQSLFQEAINNPLVEIAANVLAPGYGTLFLTAARAANGQTLHGADYANLLASFAPTGGQFLSDVTKGAVSPTIGSGIISGGAAGLAGGDVEDMIKAGVINIGANTVANILQHQVMGDGVPTSEVLNEIMPDDVAESIGGFLDENVFEPIQDAIDLSGEWELSNGDVHKIDDLRVGDGGDLVSIETGDVVGHMDDVINEITYDLNLPDFVTDSMDIVYEVVAGVIGGDTGRGGSEGQEGVDVPGSVEPEEEREEPEISTPPEEIEDVEDEEPEVVTPPEDIPQEEPEVVTPPEEVDDPFEDTTEDPDVSPPAWDTPPEDVEVPGGVDMPSLPSGGGGGSAPTESEWSELFPYTTLTPAKKKALLPHINYIRSIKA